MFHVALGKIQALPKDFLCCFQFSCRDFNHELLVSRNDDVAASAFALGLGDESEISNGVVDDLALISTHRLKGNRAAISLDLRHSILGDLLQYAGAFLAVSIDVQDKT